MYVSSVIYLLSRDKVTLKKLPQPLVSSIFKWRLVFLLRIEFFEFFDYVVQRINSPTVGIYQQSRIVNLDTRQSKIHVQPGSKTGATKFDCWSLKNAWINIAKFSTVSSGAYNKRKTGYS